MQIQTIDKSAFKQIEKVRQVIVHDYAQKFAFLDLGEPMGGYGLSWRTQLVEPIVKISTTQSLVWVGVDQQLAAISLQSGRLALVMPLTSIIVQILIVDELTTVLTENEVLLFNPNGSLRFNHGLPEVAEEISIVRNGLEIRLMDGTSLTLDPLRGTISNPEYA